MKRLILLASAIMVVAFQALYAQNVIDCRGLVADDQGEPVIGATVQVSGTSNGISTDIDGRFSIKVPKNAKELKISGVGYKTTTVAPKANLGVITLQTDATMLQDVVVTQSRAKTRVTPVAVSEISGQLIELKLGNQEFPEILKTTPGVWATKDGGGFGDSKTNMRGFQSANVAVLVNGIPVNDMEWGGVYWSNWAGLSDVTSSMQTQRGIGASMLSAPSVGGTINITTRSLDVKKGGSAWFGMGNDGMTQEGISLSTGVMKNGWALTVLGSHRQGDGYVQGTSFNSFNYFVNVSKRINEAHQLSLTAFGAPQTHDKRSSQNGLSIQGWQDARTYMGSESRYKYNPTFGYDSNGQVRSSTLNTYHKPQISLNHIWQIDHKSSLSSTAYVSLSSGGGYSGQGRGTYNGTSLSNSAWYGATNGVLSTLFRNDDGTFAYNEIEKMNASSTTGSNMVMSQSNNSHEWYGLVSSYRNEILPKTFVITGGLDVRYYVGHHNNKIIDLYGGDYFIDDSSRRNVKAENNANAANPAWQYQKLGIGDVVYRDYDGHTHQEGLYAQGEYTLLDSKLNLVLAGSISNTGYWRVDNFYYDKAHAKSEVLNFIGGTAKVGANYNINKNNNVFINAGYISRAPFFSGGAFLQSTVSNATNPDALNEKIYSVEGGYGYHSPVFSADVNVYFTKWNDKTSTRSGEITAGEHAGDRYMFNMQGVDARHMGVEMNFVYSPARWFEFSGMFSWGDYQWDSNAVGYFYNQTGQPLSDLRGNIASGIYADDHARAMLNQKGVKVGGSAQTTGALGLTFRPFKGFRVGADWVMNARNYSDYQISASSYQPGADINVKDPWEIPWGNQLDLNASYSFNISKDVRATLTGNVNNLFNYNYIMDAYTDVNSVGAWDNAYRIYYSFGRTYSIRLKVHF
ncbi:MAG: carboxypeptidase-like regulatory domain-containing protein [Muribaculaceae bacterium]|nr:carboxypeptidase-like regulatory domain-containing protein [Muribaculaceae bacterium]